MSDPISIATSPEWRGPVNAEDILIRHQQNLLQFPSFAGLRCRPDTEALYALEKIQHTNPDRANDGATPAAPQIP